MKAKVIRTLMFSVLLLISQSQAGEIAESLKNTIARKGSPDIIIELPSVIGSVLSVPVLTGFSEEADLEPKNIDTFIKLLKKSTLASQTPFVQLLELLRSRDQATFYWISNKIAVRNASPALISALSLIPGAFTIREPHIVQMTTVYKQVKNPNLTEGETEVQWGVKQIGAPSVWAKKFKGANVVVANIDSGVNVEHEALKVNYRGGEGSWFDAVNNNNTGPYDDNGQGTHTMGTICGNTRGIGVAPEAKWIACKALNSEGVGTEAQLTACAQWILKPNGNSQLRPQIVSNGWGVGQNEVWFDDEITAWRYAGIIPIFAIGNGGSACKSAISPGDRPGVISVGSTQFDDTISAFSSRGNTSTGRLKPEVSGPGDMILSAGHTGVNSYVTQSGTSMAASHVAGAVALLMGGKRASTSNQVYKRLTRTTVKPLDKVNEADLKCGPVRRKKFPNNAYGYGRIDILKAMGL